MKQDFLAINPKLSVSLANVMSRRSSGFRPTASMRTAGFVSEIGRFHEVDRAASLVETQDPDAAAAQAVSIDPHAEIEILSGSTVSITAEHGALNALAERRDVTRLAAKPVKDYWLSAALPDMNLVSAAGTRLVAEDGSGVCIGIVDSGFDLSHPMFRDAAGNLRVDHLLDQFTGTEFNRQQLEQGWANGTNPGSDTNGHGTHVASIAGGSSFNNLTGIAPAARFLLVKTDLINTDRAVAWIFRKAGTSSCVVNMSLGHHGGPHDGTDAEERLFSQITGQGRLIVVAAGNERTDRIHFGGRFTTGQSHTARIDLDRQPVGPANAMIHFWCGDADAFRFSIVSPDGQVVSMPALNQMNTVSSSEWDASLTFRTYPFGGRQISVDISLRSFLAPVRLLRNWQIQITCDQAGVGRLDGWFRNSGFGQFQSDEFVETARTLGLPATSAGVIAVASHVTAASWDSDSGRMTKQFLVPGRSSSFSGMGPTRDGREKPEISAPGEMIVAALAANSELSNHSERAHTFNRLLTIEGTSMASPMVAGCAALALQKNRNLTPAALRTALQQSGFKDGHTGNGTWSPQYGYGKLDIAKLISLV